MGVSDISTKWKSPNEGIPGYTCDLRLETSGKLVLSSMEDGSTIWESTVPESAKQMNNFWLVVDDDGVLRIYGSRDGVTPQKFRSAGSFEEIWSSDDEQSVEPTDAPEPETTPTSEEWCGHGFMMDDETNECFEERDRAFLWAMKDKNTPMLYGWPSLIRDPNMLHDYYAYDRKITSPNNDYAFINTHCSLILHIHEWGVSDISTKWKSPNEGIPGYTCDLRLETSGKLVLSSMEDGSTIWESTVPESAKQMNNFWLVVDDDGVLRIYGSRDGVTPQKFRSAGSFEEIWSSED